MHACSNWNHSFTLGLGNWICPWLNIIDKQTGTKTWKADELVHFYFFTEIARTACHTAISDECVWLRPSRETLCLANSLPNQPRCNKSTVFACSFYIFSPTFAKSMFTLDDVAVCLPSKYFFFLPLCFWAAMPETHLSLSICSYHSLHWSLIPLLWWDALPKVRWPLLRQ